MDADLQIRHFGRGKAVGGTPTTWSFLDEVVALGRPVLVAGNTFSAKSTMLAALMAAVPASERIALVAPAPELVDLMADNFSADNVYFFGTGDRHLAAASSPAGVGSWFGDEDFWKLEIALRVKAKFEKCSRLVLDVNMGFGDREITQYLLAATRFNGAVASLCCPDIDTALAVLRHSARRLASDQVEQVLAGGLDVLAIMGRPDGSGTVGFVKDLVTITHDAGGMTVTVVDHYEPGV